MGLDENFDLTPVTESEVPSIIQDQFSKMRDAKDKLSVAQDKSHSAKSRANESKDKKTGVFKNKQAIENLQDVAVELADAQLAATQAQVKAFEYQQTLAEITKYLFGLGVTNIAMNRCVVRELEMRLDQASEEEIDEMTANEITNVVKQLKAQEDIMIKQSKMSEILKEHDGIINDLKVKNRLLDDKAVILEEKNAHLEERVRELVEENHKQKKIKSLIYLAIGLGIVAIILGIVAIIL